MSGTIILKQENKKQYYILKSCYPVKKGALIGFTG
jgi:hypothetical protein